MISAIFTGMPVVLLAAALYWARPRGRQRPPGTLSLSALLACFAIAFSAYSPVLRGLEDSTRQDMSRLISNIFTLAAGASVSSVLLHLNHDAAEARRRLRVRLSLLALAVVTMALMFAITPQGSLWSASRSFGQLDRQPASLHTYSVAYILYLAFAVTDCLTQTWARSRTAQRVIQRIGLRMTAAGCVLALVYTAYKTINAVSAVLGWSPIPGGPRCTSLVTPLSCAFSVTAPALGVLLIATGLTLPALAWPITQLLRRRWELRSVTGLDPLWQDITTALPHVVLDPADDTAEADFFLHRRVIEISDGILALRAYRSPAIEQAVAQALAQQRTADATEKDAIIEAAIIASALQAVNAGADPERAPAPPARNTQDRDGDLRAETMWLRSVARAYADNEIVHSVRREAAVHTTAQGRA
ncbi:MAG: hypothetical protein QOF84_7656 [Streptomyces sp.]|nr:hypothetical protein [Streptomyces sp.]